MSSEHDTHLGKSAAERARDEQLDRWFAEYLDAQDEGLDIGARLLEQAGALRGELEERLAAQRRLGALAGALGDQQAPALSERFGHFTVFESLGRGGLGRVHRARDDDLEREVALKVLRHTKVLNRSQRDWIQNEAQALARLEHPGIVRVHEVGEVDGQSYLSMELLPGPTLEALIACWAGAQEENALAPGARAAAERLRPVRARVALLLRLADALVHCHAHGILHRDVKPGNVLLDADGNPKWIDFGLAHRPVPGKDTSMGLTLESLAGTPAYLAPEQVESGRAGADPRSDQFSFGTLCYECFALENPFQRDSRPAIQDAVARAEPAPLSARVPDIAPDLARVIHHALERDPGARYPSMAALAADLRAILADRPISVAEPSLAHLGRLWLRRHRRGVTVASGALAVALGLGVGFWALQVLAEQREIRAGLAAIRPEEFGDASALEKSAGPLLDLQGRARAFDAGLARPLLFGRSGPEVEEVAERWSASLDRLHDRDRGLSETEGVALQDMAYRELMRLDERLCPPCSFNLEARERGKVRLPPGALEDKDVELMRMTPLQLNTLLEDGTPASGAVLFELSHLSAFRRTAKLELLVPGTYLLLGRDPATGHVGTECTFRVPEGWRPALRLERVDSTRFPDWELSVAVDRTEHSLAWGNGQMVVPAFRILPRVVTTAELAEFLREASIDPGQADLNRPPDAPAAASYDLALLYSASKGARLPTAVELMTADAAGKISLPPVSELSEGELVLDVPLLGSLDHGYVSYARRTLEFASPPDALIPTLVLSRATREARLLAVDAEPLAIAYFGFRLAYSADEFALYQRLAREPLQK